MTAVLAEARHELTRKITRETERGIEAVHETWTIGAAVTIVPTRQGATGAAPKFETDGTGAVRNYGGTGVALVTEGTTDMNEAAPDSGVIDRLGAAHEGDCEAGRRLDLPGVREAVRASSRTAETAVETAAGIVETAHARTHEPTDEREAAAALACVPIDEATGVAPVLDDIAADHETAAAAQPIPTIPQGQTHAPPAAAAATDRQTETRTETATRTAKTATGKETARATAAADHGPALARRPCRMQRPRMSWKNGNSKKLGSGRRKPKHTWRLRRTPGRRASRSPASTTRRLVVVRRHLRRDTRVMDKQLTDMPLEPGTRDIGAGRAAPVGIGPDTASETPETETETATVTVTAIGTAETATTETPETPESGTTTTRTGESAIETAAGTATETVIETATATETDGPDEIAAYRPAERDIAAGAAAGAGVDEVFDKVREQHYYSSILDYPPFCVFFFFFFSYFDSCVICFW